MAAVQTVLNAKGQYVTACRYWRHLTEGKVKWSHHAGWLVSEGPARVGDFIQD
ncbi:hypothetical protein ZHAS_00021021 [Anopheles sinensis]|uniref:Uncharacterized protein n=1 Tax=Anopheles sinensis TaxID=74873 RepID=A0A084WR84_ANOSI|nr:hypothetical protein ZHAS_00021021 [Anopheles sinensis]